MRNTPGTTSVTSSDAGSCSCLGGRARGWVSVMPAGYRPPRERPDRPVPIRCTRAARTSTQGRLASATAPHASTTSSSSRRPTACSPTGRPSVAHTDRDADAGHARDVERRRVRHRTHPADLLPADLERRRTLGDERGGGRGRCEQQVDLVEHRTDRREQLEAAAQRTHELFRVDAVDRLQPGPRDRSDVVPATARRVEVVGGGVERGDQSPRAARAAAAARRRRRARCPASAHNASAASYASFSTSGSQTAKPSVDDHAARLPRSCATASPETIASSYERTGPRQRHRVAVRRARDRVDVTRRVAHRPAHRARHRRERAVEVARVADASEARLEAEQVRCTTTGCGSSRRRRSRCRSASSPTATAAADPPDEPPGRALRVPRVARRAVQIGAGPVGRTELGRRREPDEHRARGLQPGGLGVVVRADGVAVQQRPVRVGPTRDLRRAPSRPSARRPTTPGSSPRATAAASTAAAGRARLRDRDSRTRSARD